MLTVGGAPEAPLPSLGCRGPWRYGPSSAELRVPVSAGAGATPQGGGRWAFQGRDSHGSPLKCLGSVRGHSRAPWGDKGNQGYRDGQLSILGSALATRTLHVSTWNWMLCVCPKMGAHNGQRNGPQMSIYYEGKNCPHRGGLLTSLVLSPLKTSPVMRPTAPLLLRQAEPLSQPPRVPPSLGIKSKNYACWSCAFQPRWPECDQGP